VISEYCRKCGGDGRVRVKKNIKVKIPVGVNNGSTLRVRGEGDAGPRGYPFHPSLFWPSVTNLYVLIKHPCSVNVLHGLFGPFTEHEEEGVIDFVLCDT